MNALGTRVHLGPEVTVHQYDAVTMGHTSSDRTSLRRRVGVLGCVFVALVVFSVGLCTLMVRTWGHAVDQRGNLRIAAAEVADLRLAYSDQETGVRGYLLSGDSSFLDPYDHGLALAQAMQERLRQKARVGVDLDPQIDRVDAAGERWRDDVAQPAIDNPTETIDEQVVRTLASMAEFRPRMTHEADSLELVEDLILAGLGVGLLPRDRRPRPGVDVLALRTPGVRLRAYAVTRRGRAGWPALALVLDRIVRRADHR